MENHFDYAISLGDDFDEDEAMIPSMIVQPFVENAVWHGISQLKNQTGRIFISFSLETEDTIKISVEDNGPGKSQAEPDPKNSIQHLNLSTEVTRRRLELLGKKHKVHTSVSYHEANPGQINPGTKVVLIVPVSYSA
jgi:LytS/YehU family sensor histidine kinase